MVCLYKDFFKKEGRVVACKLRYHFYILRNIMNKVGSDFGC